MWLQAPKKTCYVAETLSTKKIHIYVTVTWVGTPKIYMCMCWNTKHQKRYTFICWNIHQYFQYFQHQNLLTVSLSFPARATYLTSSATWTKNQKVKLKLLTMLHEPKICICICWNICQYSPLHHTNCTMHQNWCVLTFLHLALHCMIAQLTTSVS